MRRGKMAVRVADVRILISREGVGGKTDRHTHKPNTVTLTAPAPGLIIGRSLTSVSLTYKTSWPS